MHKDCPSGLRDKECSQVYEGYDYTIYAWTDDQIIYKGRNTLLTTVIKSRYYSDFVFSLAIPDENNIKLVRSLKGEASCKSIPKYQERKFPYEITHHSPENDPQAIVNIDFRSAKTTTRCHRRSRPLTVNEPKVELSVNSGP